MTDPSAATNPDGWTVHEQLHALDRLLEECEQFSERTPSLRVATLDDEGSIDTTEHALAAPIGRMEAMRSMLLMQYGRTMWESGVAMTREWRQASDGARASPKPSRGRAAGGERKCRNQATRPPVGGDTHGLA